MTTGKVVQNVRETNERLTGPPARRLLENANLFDGPFDDLQVLDNACGGGILTRELFGLAEKQHFATRITCVVAGDIDDRMLSYVDQLSQESGWKQVETLRYDQQAVPLEDMSFTHILSNFGAFFSPDEGKVLSETLRLLKPNGIAGFTSWKYLGWWHDIAVPALEQSFPDAPALPHPSTLFPSRGWDDPERVREKLEGTMGLKDVKVEELTFTPETEAESFAAACAVLVKGMAAKLWPKEVSERYAEQIQPAFARFLQKNHEGGRWSGKMVAIVATGSKQ